MPAKPFEATLRHRPRAAVVVLRGDVDGSAQRALNAAYDEAEAKDPAIILLNFAGVNYVNSTGIALIVGLLAKARASKRRILACGLSDHYVTIFDVTRLSDFVGVFPDEASALTGATKR
jgi:anti-anti-sigma factor